jgi:anti-anti-sigma factor
MDIVKINLNLDSLNDFLRALFNSFLNKLKNEFDISTFFSINDDNKIKFEFFINKFQSDLSNLKYPEFRTKDIALVISELISNSLKHGCKKPKQRFLFKCFANKDYVLIEIKQNVNWELPHYNFSYYNKEITVKGLQLVWKFSNGNLHLLNNGRLIKCILTRDFFECDKIETCLQQCIILRPNGQIAEKDGECLKTNVMNLIINGYKYILLDITDVKMIYSPGLGTLSYLHQQLITNCGKLVIIGKNDYILYLLKATNLDKVLNVYTNSREAINDIISFKINSEATFESIKS